jgi:hypothetical protein
MEEEPIKPGTTMNLSGHGYSSEASCEDTGEMRSTR